MTQYRHRGQRRPSDADTLTAREQEIVDAVVAGHVTAKRLAGALGISPRTVQTHLSEIYAKLGVVNMTGLALWAVAQRRKR